MSRHNWRIQYRGGQCPSQFLVLHRWTLVGLASVGGSQRAAVSRGRSLEAAENLGATLLPHQAKRMP